MNSEYGPETLEDKPGELLDLAVDTSFKELNYAIDAILHAEGDNEVSDEAHKALYVLEFGEGVIDVLNSVWDKVPSWLIGLTRTPNLLPGKLASMGQKELEKLLLGELKDHFEGSVRSYYKKYTDRIPDHIRPYPTLWKTTLEELKKVNVHLGNRTVAYDPSTNGVALGSLDGASINADLLTANDCILSWNGDFADGVDTYYLNPLTGTVLPNDLVAVHSMYSYGASLHNLAIAKRRELSGIVDGVEDALNDLKAGDFQDDLKKTLYLLSGVASIASAGLSAGAAVAVASVGVGLAAAEEYLPDDPKKGDINFASAFPAHVIAKLGAALTELEDNYQSQVDAIAASMHKTAGDISAEVKAAVSGNRQGVFTMQTPDIANATDGELVDPDNLTPA